MLNPKIYYKTGKLRKPCSKCSKNQRNAYGDCRPCATKAAQRYRERNREKTNLIARIYCSNNPDKRKALRAKYRAKNLVKVKRLLRKNWAPGESDRAELVKRVLGVANCECCGSKNPRYKLGFVADHDHKTGFFRGYLCSPCNIRLGYAEKYGLDLSDTEKAYLFVSGLSGELARAGS